MIKHSALSQGVLSICAQAINSFVMYFATILIINHLGEVQYGIFTYTMVITGVTSIIADFGMNPIVLRLLSQYPAREKQIIAEASAVRILLFFVTVAVSNLIAVFQQQDPEFYFLLNVMLLNVLFSAKLPVLRGTFESYFRAKSRMSLPTLFALLDSSLLLCSVLLMPELFQTPRTAMLAYTASNIPGFLLILVSVLRSIRSSGTRWIIRMDSVRYLLRESAPLVFYYAFTALFFYVDSMYLDWFYDKREVGVYNAALRLAIPLFYLPTMLGWAFAPFIARYALEITEEAKQKISLLFSIGMKTLLLISLAVAVIAVCSTSGLVQLAFRGGYADSAKPLLLLLLGYPFMAINLFQIELNTAMGLQKHNRNYAMIIGGLTILLGFVLVRDYGATGAAATKLIALFLGAVYIIARMRRAVRWNAGSTMVKMLPIVSLALTFVVIASAIHWTVLSVGIMLWFVGGSLVLKIFSSEEITVWKSQLRKVFQ